MGVEYVKKHPWELAEFEIERFTEYMGRPAGTKNKATKSPADEFIAAMKFIGVASKNDNLNAMLDHCIFKDGYVMLTNGQITAGYPIDNEITCAPNYKLLLKSLTKVGKTLAMTQLENNRLSIKGDSIRAIVPGVDIGDMPNLGFDAPIVPISDALKAAFEACGVFTSESGDRLVETSLRLRANDCTGSDGKSLVQYWHGIDLPPNLLIPVSFTKGVIATAQPLTSFGWTQGHSITFFFEGGMWIKTLLYADEWPEIDQLFDANFNTSDIPEKLLEGVDAVDDFSENNAIYLRDNSIGSHTQEGIGATYDVPGLQGGKIIDPKYLKKLLPLAKQIDYTTHQDRVFFVGENLRGIFMARHS